MRRLAFITAAILAGLFACTTRAEPPEKSPTIAFVPFAVPIEAIKNPPAGFGTRTAKVAVQELLRIRAYRNFKGRLAAPLLPRTPWNEPQMWKILAAAGHTSEDNTVVAGIVDAVQVGGKPRRAHVTITVTVVNVAAGEVVSEIMAPGESSTTGSTSDSVLIKQAVANAAHIAAGWIDKHTLPVAVVSRVYGSRSVRIDRGKRDGVKAGQGMVLLRDGKRVGRVRAIHVCAADSDATILEPGEGIHPGDRAVACVTPFWGYN